MRFETTSRPLRELLHEFSIGAIQLPQFQRDYVWRPNKIRNLLDSLLRGYPVGGFYLWRPQLGTAEPKKKAFGELCIGREFVGFLIDGQQRLTSLEAAYGLFSGEDKAGVELRCYLDLNAAEDRGRRDTRLFVTYGGNRSIANRVERGDPALIPVAELTEGSNFDLLRKTQEGLAATGWSARRVGDALCRLDRACKMLGPSVPVTTVYDASDKDAIEVFDRLNKGGVSLRQGDVQAATLARGSAAHVLKRMREYVAGERTRRLGFSFSFAFRALVVFHRESARFSRLAADWIEQLGPHKRTLAESWRVAERALDAALRFADQDMGWSRRTLVPSTNALIVLAVAFDRAGLKPIASDRSKFRCWLCLTALRGVFQGSVETTIDRYVRGLPKPCRSPGPALVHCLKRNERGRVRAEELNRHTHLWGSVTQVLFSLFKSQGATDWVSGEAIEQLARDGASVPRGRLTVHHIFARNLLKKLGRAEDANRPSNFALLSLATNAQLGDDTPAEVLKGLESKGREAAAIQCLDDSAGDRLRPDGYGEFCEWRARRLAGELNAWLGLGAQEHRQ